MTSELGEWEKHTKGIGAKLLLQVISLIYIVNTTNCKFIYINIDFVPRWDSNQAKVKW